MKSEEQWVYQTTTKRGGRVYRKGNKYKYIDKGLESLENCVEQIKTTSAKINKIEAKLKNQGIDLFIKENL